jgi:hypothetical protein
MANIDDDDIEVGEFDDDELADGFGEEIISEEAPDLEDDSLEDDSIEDSDDDVPDEADVVLAPVEKAVVDPDDDPEIELDVELALDEIVIVPVRFADEVEEDEDAPSSSSTTEIIDAPLPRQADEFRCTSCHLLKNVSQLADKDKILCRDCV